MIRVNKIIDELYKKNPDLYQSFFPKIKYNFSQHKIKHFKKFKIIIVIGMGGSILGAKAIYYFLKKKINKKFIFIDNLNQEDLKKAKKDNNLHKALFLIISKSGNTTETIVNLSFFSKFVKRNNTIIISEKSHNTLSKFAKRKNFFLVGHNKNIGGRYSIFSDVGMLSASLMGLKPEKFKKNIPNLIKNKKYLKNISNEISKKNFKKIKVLVLFNYVPELNNFMFWIQQLFAESLGKKNSGFIPVVSNAPKDHHSLLQLYLDGPTDKSFYVFSSEVKKKYKVNMNIFDDKVKFLNKRSYENIKLSQKNAFINTLKEKKIPYREFLIKKFNEETLGNLFFLFILETIALGKVFKVNPYDQPAVERVKVLTKKIIKSKKL